MPCSRSPFVARAARRPTRRAHTVSRCGMCVRDDAEAVGERRQLGTGRQAHAAVLADSASTRSNVSLDRRRRRWAARRTAPAPSSGRRGAPAAAGRVPVIAAMASGNLAGCAVDSMTVARSSGRQRALGGDEAAGGVRIGDVAAARLCVGRIDARDLVPRTLRRRRSPAAVAPPLRRVRNGPTARGSPSGRGSGAASRPRPRTDSARSSTRPGCPSTATWSRARRASRRCRSRPRAAGCR